jgi:hypothetical protein
MMLEYANSNQDITADCSDISAPGRARTVLSNVLIDSLRSNSLITPNDFTVKGKFTIFLKTKESTSSLDQGLSVLGFE